MTALKYIVTSLITIFCLSTNAWSEAIVLPNHITYTKGQGLLPVSELSKFFDVSLDVDKPDCDGRHDYSFGSMTIYRGAVDHEFHIIYKYETDYNVCFITLISKSDQFKFSGKGWDSPWVEPRPNNQVWCLSPNPEDCVIITS